MGAVRGSSHAALTWADELSVRPDEPTQSRPVLPTDPSRAPMVSLERTDADLGSDSSRTLSSSMGGLGGRSAPRLGAGPGAADYSRAPVESGSAMTSTPSSRASTARWRSVVASAAEVEMAVARQMQSPRESGLFLRS